MIRKPLPEPTLRASTHCGHVAWRATARPKDVTPTTFARLSGSPGRRCRSIRLAGAFLYDDSYTSSTGGPVECFSRSMRRSLTACAPSSPQKASQSANLPRRRLALEIDDARSGVLSWLRTGPFADGWRAANRLQRFRRVFRAVRRAIRIYAIACRRRIFPPIRRGRVCGPARWTNIQAHHHDVQIGRAHV